MFLVAAPNRLKNIQSFVMNNIFVMNNKFARKERQKVHFTVTLLCCVKCIAIVQ